MRNRILIHQYRARSKVVKVVFDHPFEERKATEYLLNFINSSYVYTAPYKLFNYAGEVLGDGRTLPLLKKKIHKEKAPKEDMDSLLKKRMEEVVPAKMIVETLKDEIAELLRRRLQRLSRSRKTEMETRLERLKEAFKMTSMDTDVLALCFFLDMEGVVRTYLNGQIADMTRFNIFRNHCHIPLGLKRGDVSRVFSGATLFETSMLEKQFKSISISDWCAEYLSGVGEPDLRFRFYGKENDTPLGLSDFEIPEDEIAVLGSLMRSESGHNILFYGEPGTGKTSLAKCIAKSCQKNLLTVKMSETDEHEERLRAVCATINLAEPENSIVLVDEADDILNTYSSPFFKSRNDKGWINTLLESHKKKAIWITNQVDQVNPSTMRRFSFSMEFKKFSEKRRFSVLVRELARNGLAGNFSEQDLRDLCRTYNVDAGGIVNAIKIVNVDKTTDKEAALRKIRTVLKNHEKVTMSWQSRSIRKRKTFVDYSLDCLNCSEPPGQIVGILRRFVEKQTGNCANAGRPMSLLLHGIPGTGKSEFVYYLGHTLGREVTLRRCSEIQSMWVGETEKNIATAFREAHENNRLLFFDEADSFLYPRKDAAHSWEKSFTNEILTQMEDFPGIVIFATNDIAGLDQASMRRFRFKIEFRPLTAEGVLNLYNALLLPLLPGISLSVEEQERLMDIENLTPGDFAVVRDQFALVDRADITHGKLIAALQREAQYRNTDKGSIGFRNCA